MLGSSSAIYLLPQASIADLSPMLRRRRDHEQATEPLSEPCNACRSNCIPNRVRSSAAIVQQARIEPKPRHKPPKLQTLWRVVLRACGKRGESAEWRSHLALAGSRTRTQQLQQPHTATLALPMPCAADPIRQTDHVRSEVLRLCPSRLTHLARVI